MLALWCGLVAYAVLIMETDGNAAPLCSFKRLTGTPCPTCGGTRAALRLADGDVLGAFLFNPLLFVTLLFLTVVVALRFIAGKRIDWGFSTLQRRIVWVVLIAAFLLNWAYVITYVG